MNCREFNNNLTEYVGGRLSASQSARMQGHATGCADCARVEQDERDLAARFAAVPPVGACPDLWLQLQRHLEAPVVRRPVARGWAFGSAFTALAAASFVLFHQVRPVQPTGVVRGENSHASRQRSLPPADEPTIVRMVRDSRQTPAMESDTLLQNIQDHRGEERLVLLGDRGQE